MNFRDVASRRVAISSTFPFTKRCGSACDTDQLAVGEYLERRRRVCFQYEDGDEVVLWMSTVGPYHNRQETYSYYSLPFCTGTKNVINHYHETLAEALQGIELKFSGLDIEFKGMHLCIDIYKIIRIRAIGSASEICI